MVAGAMKLPNGGLCHGITGIEHPFYDCPFPIPEILLCLIVFPIMQRILADAGTIRYNGMRSSFHSFMERYFYNDELITAEMMTFLNRLIFPLFSSVYLMAVFFSIHRHHVLLLFAAQTALHPVTNFLIQKSSTRRMQAFMNVFRNITANILYYVTYIHVTDFALMLILPLPGAIANGFFLQKALSGGLTTIFFILPFLFLPDISLRYQLVAAVSIVTASVASYALSNFLNKKFRQAEQASRAKSIFLAHMSHEIRTPMNGVLGMTDILLQMESDEVKRFYLKTIEESGTEMIHILNDILDLSKLQTGRLEFQSERFDLRDLFEKSILLFLPVAQRKGIELILDFPLTIDARVTGDLHRIRQVIVNLLGNAVKFTDSGFIKILVERNVSDSDHRPLFTINVQDTGIGITTDQKENIFSEFTQAEESFARKYGGAGLGLAISRKIVEAMGGLLDLSSTPGVGSTFSVTLPLEAAESIANPVLDRLGELRILMVCRSEHLAGVFRREMTGWNRENAVFDSAAEALRYLENSGAKFDVVVFCNDTRNDSLRRVIEKTENLGIGMVICQPADSELPKDHVRKFAAVVFEPVTSRKIADAILLIVTNRDAPVSAPEELREERYSEQKLEFHPHFQILVAEDNRVNQLILGKMLEKIGAEYQMVSDGEEAVREAARKKYDILMFDIEMPKLDGIQALKKIRSEYPRYGKTAAFACTAHVLTENRENFLNAGFRDCIAKPYSLDKIREILASTVATVS